MVGARASVDTSSACTSSRASVSTIWMCTSRWPGTSGRNESMSSVSAPAGRRKESGAIWSSSGCEQKHRTRREVGPPRTTTLPWLVCPTMAAMSTRRRACTITSHASVSPAMKRSRYVRRRKWRRSGAAPHLYFTYTSSLLLSSCASSLDGARPHATAPSLHRTVSPSASSSSGRARAALCAESPKPPPTAAFRLMCCFINSYSPAWKRTVRDTISDRGRTCTSATVCGSPRDTTSDSPSAMKVMVTVRGAIRHPLLAPALPAAIASSSSSSGPEAAAAEPGARVKD
mmetsp:Transcript_13219/g.43576  ORF Transcript_13219/g.43576 Transcript_13219/m.43576 type:complete len:287 (-) Transcript_13219:331-1191(-)